MLVKLHSALASSTMSSSTLGVEKGHTCISVLRSIVSMKGASFMVDDKEVINDMHMRKESGRWLLGGRLQNLNLQVPLRGGRQWAVGEGE